MATSARCKFRIDAVTDYGVSRQIYLTAIHDASGTIPENVQFTKWTPVGTINLTITNPAVYDLFVPQTDVYVTISET